MNNIHSSDYYLRINDYHQVTYVKDVIENHIKTMC